MTGDVWQLPPSFKAIDAVEYFMKSGRYLLFYRSRSISRYIGRHSQAMHGRLEVYTSYSQLSLSYPNASKSSRYML